MDTVTCMSCQCFDTVGWVTGSNLPCKNSFTKSFPLGAFGGPSLVGVICTKVGQLNKN